MVHLWMHVLMSDIIGWHGEFWRRGAALTISCTSSCIYYSWGIKPHFTEEYRYLFHNSSLFSMSKNIKQNIIFPHQLHVMVDLLYLFKLCIILLIFHIILYDLIEYISQTLRLLDLNSLSKNYNYKGCISQSWFNINWVTISLKIIQQERVVAPTENSLTDPKCMK